MSNSGVLDTAPEVLESAAQPISDNNGVPSLYIDDHELNDKLNQSGVSVKKSAEKIGAEMTVDLRAMAEWL